MPTSTVNGLLRASGLAPDTVSDGDLLGRYNAQPTPDVSTAINTDAPVQFARELGAFVNQRMVWEAEGTQTPFRAYTHFRWDTNVTAEERRADRDPEKVLKNVSEQTGLAFKKDKRKIQVLHVATPRP